VKVYARLKGGKVRFFKDGYTDLRGKFDYASLNSSDSQNPPPIPVDNVRDGAEGTNNLGFQMLRPQELPQVERLSILVLSDTHGALVLRSQSVRAVSIRSLLRILRVVTGGLSTSGWRASL